MRLLRGKIVSNQVKLGFFVLIGIISIIISITLLGNYNFGSKYTVCAYFDDVVGLPKKAKVKIAGVDVGSIKNICLENGKAKLILYIDSDIKLYSDAKIKIVTSGIIGTKHLSLWTGTPNNPLIKNGDVIASEGSYSLEETVSNLTEKLSKILDTVSKGIDETFFNNLKDTVSNLKQVTQAVAEKEKNITKVIDNFNSFSSDLADMTNSNKEAINKIVEQIEKITEKLDKFATNINEGKGTIATLVNDEEMANELKETVADIKTTVNDVKQLMTKVNRLEIDWEYMGRYDSRNERFRNDFGIRFRPNDHKFYYVGVSNIGNTSGEKNEFERDHLNKLDALIGFRSEYLEAYGGVMRSKGGIGVGISPFDKIYSKYRRLYFNIDALFRTETAEKKNDSVPNLIIGARYGITHWLYLGVQVEDTLTTSNFMPYIKLKVTDQDLASMFGFAGIAAAGSK